MPSLLKKLSICLYVLLLAGMFAWRVIPSSPSFKTNGKSQTIQLSREALTVLEFPSKTSQTTAIIIFASGDGGWGDLEEVVAGTLQDHGYEVIGIDSAVYAKSDYDLDILEADFAQIAREAQTSYPGVPPPLIVGGYSMGAAQAIAVAGGPHPPSGLVGLLLMDPCSRGRYGLRTSDRMNILPTGPGTFSMDDFSKTMGNLRVVQWHAADDSIDSRAWLDSLTAQHQEFDFPNDGHDYGGNRDDFLRRLVSSVGWILEPTQNKRIATEKKVGP